MRNNPVRTTLVSTLAILVLLGAGRQAAAQQEKVIYSFNGGLGTPSGTLISDSSGDLLGILNEDVFELTHAGGVWTDTSLFHFSSSPASDIGGGLIVDTAGNLYGITAFGGADRSGSVFELVPQAGGSWEERTLYSFTGSNDGGHPIGPLTLDSMGNLFGTTYLGGSFGAGTVFELTPSAGGGWTESVLYSFGSSGTDGLNPAGSVVFDNSGNLYGTTYTGGPNYCAFIFTNCGTLYKLTQTGGAWTETVLHNFNGADGMAPETGLKFDSSGNLYGAASLGGQYKWGLVFEFSPGSGGTWTEHILHNFGNGTDGKEPNGVLTFDSRGNIYGATFQGGTNSCKAENQNGCGAVFELSPNGSSWHETVLHNFSGIPDGVGPNGGVILDTSGNLFGGTFLGGANGFGSVFEVTP
jgi:uncharacterized repeat protein (TIGR03803 family)